MRMNVVRVAIPNETIYRISRVAESLGTQPEALSSAVV